MTGVTTLTWKAILIVILPLFLLATLLTLNQKIGIAAPNRQPIRARTVQARLPGGVYAQIWLGLEPEFADAQITVLAEWDRLLPASNGLNFFIFDEQQLRRLGEGNNSFSSLALAAGSPGFTLSTPDHVIGAGFRSTGWASYTMVVINESPQDATFTLRVTNGFVTDGANQVTALEPSLPTAPAAFSTPSIVQTVMPLFTTEPTTAPITAPTTVATTAVTTVVTTVAITTGNATSILTQTQSATLLPEARTSLGRGKRPLRINGTLTTSSTQQLIQIKPHKTNSQILLRLAVDGEPTTTSTEAMDLNFWIFDATGLAQYLAGAAPSTRAVTIGKGVFRSPSNERVAGFRAVNTPLYTVVIHSNGATLPVSYTLSIEGAQVIENFYLP